MSESDKRIQNNTLEYKTHQQSQNRFDIFEQFENFRKQKTTNVYTYFVIYPLPRDAPAT